MDPQVKIENLKLALQAKGEAPPNESIFGGNQTSQLTRNTEGQTSTEFMKALQELESDEKIEFLSHKIDEQITDLDTKLDVVLEKHEKEFLKAYRVQMLKVQDELTQLRQRANEKELQSKQELKISALEKEIAKYRNDCEAIMKYTGMQKQLIADYTLRRRELREDEIYLETEVTQSKVDKIRLKIALSKE